MSDIVERLQAYLAGEPLDNLRGNVTESAAEILRLRAEVERLRAALQHVVDSAPMHPLVLGLAMTKAQEALR